MSEGSSRYFCKNPNLRSVPSPTHGAPSLAGATLCPCALCTLLTPQYIAPHLLYISADLIVFCTAWWLHCALGWTAVLYVGPSLVGWGRWGVGELFAQQCVEHVAHWLVAGRKFLLRWRCRSHDLLKVEELGHAACRPLPRIIHYHY